jgi:hypothetical protein
LVVLWKISTIFFGGRPSPSDGKVKTTTTITKSDAEEEDHQHTTRKPDLIYSESSVSVE